MAGTDTSSQFATTTYSPWTQQLPQFIAGQGLAMAAPFLKVSPYSQAGFTTDQKKAFDLARQSAQTAFAAPAQYTGDGRVTGREIADGMNPFTNLVTDRAIDNMQREYQDATALNDARRASEQAFGGSGRALSRARMARDYNRNVGDVSANLYAGAYDRATNLALANEGMGMDAARLNDSFRTSNQNRQTSALQMLLGTGGMQQDFAQQTIDTPWDMLGKVASLSPGVYDSSTQTQTETPNNEPGIFQQILGTAGAIIPSFFGS